MAAKTREGTGTKSAPGSDAYTGMLLISLLAQIAGVVFLFLDYSQYPGEKPKEPPAITAGAGAANPPVGGGPAGPAGGGPKGPAPKGPGAK